MQKSKPKILFLGNNDNTMEGHAYSNYMSFPDVFDKRIVVETTYSDNVDIAILKHGSLLYKFERAKSKLIHYLWVFLRFGKIFKRVNVERGYEYFPEYIGISASRILKKCKGFVPDVIYVNWVKGFVNYKTLRELHKLTGAYIYIVMLDHTPMTGGCHYPVNCDEYTKQCRDCKAVNASGVSSFTLKSNVSALKNVPYSIIGTPSDIDLAKKSTIFKDAKYVSGVTVPTVEVFTKSESRKEFGIPDDAFVIILGAFAIDNFRKGFIFAKEAISTFTKTKSGIVILALGNIKEQDLFKDINAQVITPGYVSFSKMCMAYCASDCYLSTTLADSGPMMVNYAFALGIPTISFRVGIANTLIQHGINGYFADYMNSNSVEVCLDTFYNLDKNIRKYMSIACKLTIDEYRNQDSIPIQVYKETMKRLIK